MQVPEIAPLAMQMLLFGVRGFKVGRELEGVFEQTLQEMTAKVRQGVGQQLPNPDADKMQAEMRLQEQKAQGEMQFAQAKIQNDTQLAQQKLQSDMQMEKYKADIKAQTDTQIAQLRAQTDLQIAQIKAQMEKEMQSAKINMDGMIAINEVNNAPVPNKM